MKWKGWGYKTVAFIGQAKEKRVNRFNNIHLKKDIYTKQHNQRLERNIQHKIMKKGQVFRITTIDIFKIMINKFLNNIANWSKMKKQITSIPPQQKLMEISKRGIKNWILLKVNNNNKKTCLHNNKRKQKFKGLKLFIVYFRN